MNRNTANLQGLYSMSPLISFTQDQLNTIIHHCKKYCMDNIGINRDVKLSIINTHPKQDCYGEYCPNNNTITLYKNEFKTLGQFTSTFIHEYTHSLQPIKTKYYKLLVQYGYDDHPHEIEASNNEFIHNRRLLKYLRNSLIILP
jgi:hypothetical protein